MRPSLTRRAALYNLSAFGLLGVSACAPDFDPDSRTDQMTGALDGTVVDAFFYAFGPYEFARSMQALSGQIHVGDRLISEEALADAAQRAGGADVLINRHIHVRDLADERIRSVTAPNNDTLYTSAVLELSQTPVRLIVSEHGERYLSIALMDMFTDQRMVGAHGRKGAPGEYLIIGPDSPLEDGPFVIRMLSNDAWLLARTFVAGVEDLEAARQVQSGISVEPLDPEVQPRRFITRAPADMEPESFLALTNEVLGRSPGHPQVERSAHFVRKGIVPGRINAWEDLSLGARLAWSRWLPRALPRVRQGLSRTQSRMGWNTPPVTLGDYGENDVVRAAIALIGFGALRTEDARYFRTETDEAGEELNGAKTYQMVIPSEGVPVEAFWSLSLYEPDADGRLFFYETPLDRHSINSGSSDLVRAADGSIVLQLSRERPTSDGIVWIPTPAGKFEAIFRTYEPQEAVIVGSWSVPPIERIH